MRYSLTNIVKGGLIYSLGDTIASLILEDFLWTRLFGMLLIGMTFYAIEIPNYFYWIERKTLHLKGMRNSMAKTALALVYFNPLWIARHLLFIKLITLDFDKISWNLMHIAWISFVVNVPISILANYVIQNKIVLRWRFVASALFSGLMAIYYAMSENWFGL